MDDSETIEAQRESGESHFQFSKELDSLDNVLVTLTHASGKQVDVANKHLSLDGDTLIVEHAETYRDLYADESESNQFQITVEVNGE